MSPGRLTLFRSDRACLAKTWCLKDGVPEKKTAAQLTDGSFSVREFDSAATLAALLGAVTTREAVSASVPRCGLQDGRVTTRARRATEPAALTRTKADFGLSPGPGFVLLDHDAPAGSDGWGRDELLQRVLACAPELAGAGMVWLPSGSSYIWNGPDQVTGLGGQHVFVLLQDASDGPRIVKLLARRMWLVGHGRVRVSSAGSLLIRGPVDTAVADPARLVFCGGAECVPPLRQERGAPVVLQDGGFLDSRLIGDLTAEERAKYEALVEQAKAAKAEEAAAVKVKHRAATIGQRVPALMQQGVSAADAERRIGEAVDAAYAGTLLADFVVTVAHDDGQHEHVSVRDILADRDRWHECRCLDPLNPGHRSGAADAVLLLQGTSPFVYSFDDDGQVYRLRNARQRLAVGRGRRGELVESICEGLRTLPYVFSTSVGPVILNEKRTTLLTVERLMNVVGREFSLYAPSAKGDSPMDLPGEVAKLVLANLT